MQIKIKIQSIVFIFLISVFLLFVPKTHSVNNFEENFDSYSDGQLPNNWTIWPSENVTFCSSQWRIKDGMIGAPINGETCITNIMPDDTLWQDLGNNYIFDVDMKFVAGTDHNILFRVKPDRPGFAAHEIHFGSPGDFDFTPDYFPGTYATKISGTYENGNTYHLKIIVNNNNTKVYIDNLLVRDFTQLIDSAPEGRIGLRSGTGGDLVSETWFDNIKVQKIDNSVIQFPDVSIHIPLIKQSDSAWKNKTYDNANTWNPNDPTVNSWGCALTSVVMILKYHGINKLPDKTLLNPDTLNDWLKTQKDGYIGNGLVNWVAISRLSFLSKKVNKITTFDALEFKKQNTDNIDLVKNDLSNNTPNILGIPGHFVVAKGIKNNDIEINDPYYEKTLLSQHENKLKSINTFTPSFTDLSYIVLVVNSDVDIELQDSNGNKIAEGILEESLQSATDQTLSNKFKTIYFPRPNDINYKIKITSNNQNNYDLKILLYDKQGNVLQSSRRGIIQANQNQIIPINYLNRDNFYQKKVSLDSLTQDVTNAFIKKQIKSLPLRLEIEKLIIKAKIEKSFNKKMDELETLNKLEELVTTNKNTRIIDPAFSKIIYDINYLQTHI